MSKTSYIFDLDDTLYLKTDPFVLAVGKIFPAVTVDPYVLYQSFKKRGNESFEPSMRGEITVEEMYIYRISKALEDHGFSCTDAEALEFQKAYNYFQDHLAASPLMLEVIRKCVECGAFVGIITNGLSDHQRDKFYALGLDKLIPENHVIVSEDVGVNKPDPELFRHAAQKWNLDQVNTVYIGDSMFHDVACAKQCGWKAVLILHAADHTPAERAALRADYEKTEAEWLPDLVVSDYNELLAVIPEL